MAWLAWQVRSRAWLALPTFAASGPAAQKVPLV